MRGHSKEVSSAKTMKQLSFHCLSNSLLSPAAVSEAPYVLSSLDLEKEKPREIAVATSMSWGI